MSLDHGASHRQATTQPVNLAFRPRHACSSRSNHLEKKTFRLISLSSTMKKFVEASLCCKSVSDVEDFLAFKQAECKRNKNKKKEAHFAQLKSPLK